MPFHTNLPNITLGYHGCDAKVGESLLKGEAFEPSQNPWDWLGPGIYFWESNPNRAMSFAIEQKERGNLTDPFVVGAALSLGNCIDTLSENCLQGITQAYKRIQDLFTSIEAPLPKNKGGADMLIRELDCEVIKMLHRMIDDLEQPKADSLRGLYHEGGALFPGSGFYKKSHIQICISNPDCIKGVFRM